jgi:hypothetical protein
MEEMADMHRLLKRGETYFYHRRVPLHLVDIVGRKFIRQALGTDSLKEARRRRAAKDVEVDALFQQAEKGIKPGVGSGGVSLETLINYVRETVAEMDRTASKRFAQSPPTSKDQRKFMVQDAEIEIGILTNPEDPRQDELVSRASDKVAQARGLDLTDAEMEAQFAEMMRRGLIEVARRRIGRLTDLNDRAFYDAAFDPNAAPLASVSQAKLDTDIVDAWAAERKPTQKAIDSCRGEPHDRPSDSSGTFRPIQRD